MMEGCYYSLSGGSPARF
uniref:Uncharacterized protein n=1 Tax=Anguilla anguilla TaxID=7936 RepID=A0A0E9SWV2_ANGAN